MKKYKSKFKNQKRIEEKTFNYLKDLSKFAKELCYLSNVHSDDIKTVLDTMVNSENFKWEELISKLKYLYQSKQFTYDR